MAFPKGRRKDKPRKKRISVLLDLRVYEIVATVAEQDGVSMSAIATAAMIRGLQAESKYRRNRRTRLIKQGKLNG